MPRTEETHDGPRGVYFFTFGEHFTPVEALPMTRCFQLGWLCAVVAVAIVATSPAIAQEVLGVRGDRPVRFPSSHH
jgi:hypothetical protein